jgi:hypothetical protein
MQPEDVDDEMLVRAQLVTRNALKPIARPSEERRRQDSLNAARIIYCKRFADQLEHHERQPAQDKQAVMAYLEAIYGGDALEKLYDAFGRQYVGFTGAHARERLDDLAEKARAAAQYKGSFQEMLDAEPNGSRRRQLRVKIATPPWVDFAQIVILILERDRLSAETGVPHHIDHMIPLAGKNVCGLHVHWNMRVIPATDNLKKSAKFYEHLSTT